MSTLVQLRASPEVWVPPVAKRLDEAVWQAWELRGQARDTRRSAALLTAVKWVSAATLLAAAALWSHLGPYSVLVRFVVVLGAIALMFQSLHVRQYAFAALFGLLALLYNPVAPVIGFPGDWQRAFVVASAAPFIIASLVWRTA